jgi:hypothetical protein
MRANFAKRPSHLLTSNSKVQRKLQLFLTQDVYKDQGYRHTHPTTLSAE